MDRVIYDLLEKSLCSYELVDKDWYILGCLANVLLVLKGGRLAYLVNNTIEKELVMFKAVLHTMPELAAISASPYELLLVRKENKVQVETIFREEIADSHPSKQRYLVQREVSILDLGGSNGAGQAFTDSLWLKGHLQSEVTDAVACPAGSQSQSPKLKVVLRVRYG